MGEFFESVPVLLLATVFAYLLGSIPLADRMSRWHGVDIFAVGTGLAGSTNVRKEVGKLPGLMVLLGDLAKGALAVKGADLLGVDGSWVLLPGGAAVVGHWKSVFTRFRGGDGLATLGGATVAAFPTLGLISVAVATVISLGGQKMPYSSLLGLVAGYALLAALSLAYNRDPALALGLGGLAGLVLAHALVGHRRRRQGHDWDDDAETGGATEQAGYQ